MDSMYCLETRIKLDSRCYICYSTFAERKREILHPGPDFIEPGWRVLAWFG
jgi:hypothetical protein